MLASDFVSMNVQVLGLGFYTLKNKPSENNSDNKTSKETAKCKRNMPLLQ